MAVFIPITGIKAEGGGGGGGEQTAADQRRQLTVFTASTFSTIQPSTPPQSSGRGRKRSCPMKTEVTVAGGFNGELQGLPPTALKQKIPRPPNAFMLFANDWRRKLASQFPKESNKDISIRLGGMWKNMEKDEKEKYFQYAREVDAAHKKKYPDYVYNPKEARMRKALREQSRGERQGGGPGGSAQHRGGGGPAPWSKHRQIMNHRQPIMVGEQALHHQSHRDDCKLDGSGGMLQNFNDYLSDLSYPVTQPGEFIVPDLDQSWYSYIQGPVQNAATYLMRAPPDKVVGSNEWGTHFAADSTTYIHTSSQNATGVGNGGFLGSATAIGSREQQQHLVNGSASGQQTPTHHISSPVPDKTVVIHDQSSSNDIKDSVLSDSKSLLELSQIKVENQNGVDGNNSNKDVLRLPGFQQAFGSTEIGRFSQHEGFFEASLPQPEIQQETKSMPDPVTPPRNKLPDVDFQNPGSYILSPSTNMSPSMWSPLLYSPTTMKDGTSSSCFGSPTFPQQSPLTNFIDYSLLSGTEFMQTSSDEVINISHCSTDNSSNSGTNGLYSQEDKDLQILLAAETSCGNNAVMGSETCDGAFGNTIKPLQRIIDIDTDNSGKAPGILELCRRAQLSQENHSDTNCNNNQNNIHNNTNSNYNNNNGNHNNIIKNLYHQNRIKSAEEFADQDLKMNCVNQPPVIISENEKICVILESSNVGLDSCNAGSTAANNKQFTNL